MAVNIELIVGEIGAEIERLRRIRAILKELSSPKPRMPARRPAVPVKRSPAIVVQPEPQLIVLPPKQRREYTRRAKPMLFEPKALAAPASNHPAFVPKAALGQSQHGKAAGAETDLEAVIRQRLLGGVG